MKCFYHPQSDAVGTCKHCHRGVCRECAAERMDGIACLGRCEASVDAVNALIQRNIQVAVRSRSVNVLSFAVFSVAGAGITYLGINEEITTARMTMFMVAAICFVCALGQTSVIRSWMLERRKKGGRA
jgi:hypothetical protein